MTDRHIDRTGASAALNGRWRNRLGSVMELAVGEGDVVTGTYRSGVGTAHPDGSFPLTGYALADAVVFCVDFRPHGSVAAWTGHHVATGDGDRLVTLWHLAQPMSGAHGVSGLWQGVLAGADDFERAG
jgi:hypothetical protein